MMPVVLWTDGPVWLLVAITIGYFAYVRKHEHLAAPWRRVARSTPGMVALVVLLAFVAIGLLDSLHFRPVLEGKDQKGAPVYAVSPLRPPASGSDPIHTLQLPGAVVTVQVPTTVVWGEDDTGLLPGLLDGLERWVPQMRLSRVPEASHWIVHEQPQRVASEVARALQAAAAAG